MPALLTREPTVSESTPEVLTAQEVADLLRVRPSTGLDLARRAVLPSFKVGKHRRLLRADIASWLEQQCLTLGSQVGRR